jgi:nucleoside-diphosphate-sugar epimerase
VVRLPAVYGPGDKQHRLLPYVRRMDDERPAVLLTTDQAGWRWTRGYVVNVAAAIALAVRHSPP